MEGHLMNLMSGPGGPTREELFPNDPPEKKFVRTRTARTGTHSWDVTNLP